MPVFKMDLSSSKQYILLLDYIKESEKPDESSDESTDDENIEYESHRPLNYPCKGYNFSWYYL